MLTSYVHHIISTNTGDRSSGNTIEVDDESGKIFINIRSADDAALLELTYDDVEPFLRFLSDYVADNHGQRVIAKFIKTHRNKTLLDLLTDADIAYSFLVYESSNAVWLNDILKKECQDEEERRGWQCVDPKYHVSKRTRIPLYGDGWTEEGRSYFNELKGEIYRLRTVEDGEFWNNLVEHWKTYAKKYNRVYYEQGNVGEAVVEGGANEDDIDYDDCLIDLPGDAPLFDVPAPQMHAV